MPLRPGSVMLVAVGGMLGVAAREGLVLALPRTDLPWAVGAVNLSGAFLLGLLLELLSRRGPETRGRRDLRLFLGTGVLGGFTTYSALATDTARLASGGDLPAAAGYALASVVLGVLAAAAGVKLAAAGGRR